MKLIEKDNDTRVQSSRWAVEEIKTERELFELVASIAAIGELHVIEFHGYEDMDVHENWALFHSINEFKNGIKDLHKIEPDKASISFYLDVEIVRVSFYYKINETKNAVRMSLICCDDGVAKKVAKILEQKVKEIAG